MEVKTEEGLPFLETDAAILLKNHEGMFRNLQPFGATHSCDSYMVFWRPSAKECYIPLRLYVEYVDVPPKYRLSWGSGQSIATNDVGGAANLFFQHLRSKI